MRQKGVDSGVVVVALPTPRQPKARSAPVLVESSSQLRAGLERMLYRIYPEPPSRRLRLRAWFRTRHAVRPGAARGAAGGPERAHHGRQRGAPVALRAGDTGEFAYRQLSCDVGLVQRDALVIDLPGTVDACRAFAATVAERLEAETRWLRESGATVVVGDVPPLAFAAAAAAGVPSVAVYELLLGLDLRPPRRERAGPGRGRGPGQGGLCGDEPAAALPFAGDLSAFPRIEDVPLVARQPTLEAGEARRRLGLGARPAVLLSFGGIGLRPPAAPVLGQLPDFDFLVEGVGGEAPMCTRWRMPRLTALGLGYEDVVAAADVVVTKPGYGIVTDAIAGRTRIVYTERGDFPEYPVMVAEMGRYVPAVHLGNDDVRAGRQRCLRAVLAIPFPPLPPLDGAEVAARRLLGLL